MALSFFASDLHGRPDRYTTLWRLAAEEAPAAVFLGGDLLPHAMHRSWPGADQGGDFVTDFMVPGFEGLREQLGSRYPRVFLIMGNDDPRAFEPEFLAGQQDGLWEYCHGRQVAWAGYTVLGYSCIPPSPFLLKDWERYDVSRFVDPGSIPPEDGRRTAGPAGREILHTTIAAELDELAAGITDFGRVILLAHCPPHGCVLDRAALDGKTVDHVPLDVHIGSIAVRRFIEARQPLLALHGHVHESRRLTGRWQYSLGSTVCWNAANDTAELALVRFDPADPGGAELKLAGPAG